MDDLAARIAQQNNSRQHEVEQRGAQPMGYGSHQGMTQSPASSPLRRACGNSGGLQQQSYHPPPHQQQQYQHAPPQQHNQHGGYYGEQPPQQHYQPQQPQQQQQQQRYQAAPQQEHHQYAVPGLEHLSLQEDALHAEEAELDRMLEQERRMANGAPQQQGRGAGRGAPAPASGRGGPPGRGRGGPGQPAAAARNASRGKIPLLDPRDARPGSGAAPTQAQVRPSAISINPSTYLPIFAHAGAGAPQ